MPNLVLKFLCPDTVGIVAGITSLIAKHHGWIMAANQYSDPNTLNFFMRLEIKENSLTCSEVDFTRDLNALAKQMKMEYRLIDMRHKKRVVILTGKEYHCLS